TKSIVCFITHSLLNLFMMLDTVLALPHEQGIGSCNARN
ncbi:MAG: hypothetical protein H6Q31_973, partial [Bacteroidetes bacterium]|nr:hypothetical protein [Bacteroidota bacterium]